MAPLVVQVVAWAFFLVLGRTGVLPDAASVTGALRYALAAMFAFTALSHFMPRTRRDLIGLVPPFLPVPALLVTATGVLELAGAIGLLMRDLVFPAALALAALLVLMLPANVHAARAGLSIAGRRAMRRRYRIPLQLFWIVCLLFVAITAERAWWPQGPVLVNVEIVREPVSP